MIMLRRTFMFLLVIRSSLDIFTDVSIDIFGMNLNVPSVISMLILLMWTAFFLTQILH